MNEPTNYVRIVLTHTERDNALRIAKKRFREDRTNGLAHRFGAPNTLRPDTVGSLCEAAFARYLNTKHVKGRLGDHDVDRYQVRGTDGSGRCLILHPSDNDTDVFVLVALSTDTLKTPSGTRAICTVLGWCLGREGKDPHWWSHRGGWQRPAYFVPPWALNPLRTIPT